MKNYDNIILGRAGKEALRKACRAHRDWGRYCDKHDIKGRQPTKDEMLWFAENTGIDVPGVASIDASDSPVLPVKDKPDTTPAPTPSKIDAHVSDLLGDVAPFLNQQSIDEIMAKVNAAIDAAKRDGVAEGKAMAPPPPAPTVIDDGDDDDARKPLVICHRTGETDTKTLYGFDSNTRVSTWNGKGQPHVPAVDPDYLFDPETTKIIVANLEAGRFVWLPGPKGTGKTSFAMQHAAKKGAPFARIGMGSKDLDFEALVGGLGMENSSTFFVPGALLRAIQTPGCVILLDEPDRAPPATQSALQTLLDFRQITLPHNGEVIKFADGVQIIAAGNTAGHGDNTGLYTAANELDAATIARFDAIVPMTWLDQKQEIKVLASRLGVTQKAVTPLCKFVQKTRDAYNAGRNGDAMSMRESERWAFNILAGIDPLRAFEVTVQNALRPEYGQVMRELLESDADVREIANALLGVTPTPEPTPADDSDIEYLKPASGADDDLTDEERDLLFGGKS